MSQIAEHVRSNPPRCLAAVDAAPTPERLGDRGDDFVVFRLSKDNHTSCQVLGYDLSDYNKEYDGPLTYISPLTLRWPDDSSTCIFDSDIHGYHGELGSSAKYRGSGELSIYKCTQCGSDQMIVDAQFDYPDDLLYDCELPEVPNYFQNIIVQGTCVKCSAASFILDMDL